MAMGIMVITTVATFSLLPTNYGFCAKFSLKLNSPNPTKNWTLKLKPTVLKAFCCTFGSSTYPWLSKPGFTRKLDHNHSSDGFELRLSEFLVGKIFQLNCSLEVNSAISDEDFWDLVVSFYQDQIIKNNPRGARKYIWSDFNQLRRIYGVVGGLRL